MRLLAQIVSLIGLLLTAVPAFLVFAGSMPFERHTLLMLVGTLLWFGSAPVWMKKKEV